MHSKGRIKTIRRVVTQVFPENERRIGLAVSLYLDGEDVNRIKRRDLDCGKNLCWTDPAFKSRVTDAATTLDAIPYDE